MMEIHVEGEIAPEDLTEFAFQVVRGMVSSIMVVAERSGIPAEAATEKVCIALANHAATGAVRLRMSREDFVREMLSCFDAARIQNSANTRPV